MKTVHIALIVFSVVAIAIALAVGLAVGLSSSSSNDNVPDEKDAPPDVDLKQSSSGKYRYAAVAADAGICSTVGTEIMARYSGSAVDAMVAAAICIGAVNAHSTGVGGGLIMTIYERPNNETQKEFRSIMARETAPLDSHKDMFENDTSAKSVGGLSIAVPGELNGYYSAWQRYGRIPWRLLFEPTILLCFEGWNVTASMADAIEGSEDYIRSDPSLSEAFVKEDGSLYEEGDWMTQPRLGGTLEVIADEGVMAFYNGSLTDDVIAELQERDSIILHDDLMTNTALLKDTIERPMASGGYKVYASPPPSGGLVIQFMTKIMDGFGYHEEDFEDLQVRILFYHRLVESFKFGFAHRQKFGDEDFAGEAERYWIDKLKDDEYADEIRDKIDDDSTLDYEDYFPVEPSPVKDRTGGTVHIEVFSADGSAVSYTSTVGSWFGSKIRGNRTGIIYNNCMNLFSLPHQTQEPSNYIEPMKRPRSSTSPILVFDGDDKPHMQDGASGGPRILTSTTYVAMHNIWLGMNITDAVDYPRLHNQLELIDILYFDEGFPQDVLDGLREKGHTNQVPSEAAFSYLGVVQAIGTSYCNTCGERCTDECIHAVSDWRKGGYPDGY